MRAMRGVREWVVGGAVLALGVATLLESATFPWVGGRPGPGLFPGLIGAALALLGLLLGLQQWRGSARQGPGRPGAEPQARAAPSTPATDPLGPVRMGAVVAATLFYMVAVNRVGFAPTGILVTFGLMVLFGARPLRAFLFTAVLVGVIYALFARILLVPLPGGPWR